jgi:CheY-like chemotaxis protein
LAGSYWPQSFFTAFHRTGSDEGFTTPDKALLEAGPAHPGDYQALDSWPVKRTESTRITLTAVLHLLLIEDNPADVLLIREALRSCRLPADVIIADDGEQASRILEEPVVWPDFIILDLNIPGVDGHAILERYSSAEGPPIVVFTGSPNEEDRLRALANGARDYVVKPSGFREFMRAVQDMIEHWGKCPCTLARNRQLNAEPSCSASPGT